MEDAMVVVGMQSARRARLLDCEVDMVMSELFGKFVKSTVVGLYFFFEL